MTQTHFFTLYENPEGDEPRIETQFLADPEIMVTKIEETLQLLNKEENRILSTSEDSEEASNLARDVRDTIQEALENNDPRALQLNSSVDTIFKVGPDKFIYLEVELGHDHHTEEYISILTLDKVMELTREGEKNIRAMMDKLGERLVAMQNFTREPQQS